MLKSDDYMDKRRVRVPENPKEFIVAITSDKGLCGATNSSIIRSLKHYAKEKDSSKLTVFAIGDRGASGLARPFPDGLIAATTHTTSPINYPTAMAITE